MSNDGSGMPMDQTIVAGECPYCHEKDAENARLREENEGLRVDVARITIENNKAFNETIPSIRADQHRRTCEAAARFCESILQETEYAGQRSEVANAIRNLPMPEEP